MTTTNLIYWLTGFFVLTNLVLVFHFLTMTEEKAAAMAAKSGKPADVKTYRTMGMMILVSTPIIAGVLLYVAMSGMVG